MRQFNTLLFLAAIFVAAACHSTKYSPSKLPEDQLLFGYGGGFTGKVSTVLLLENGQIFRQGDTETSFSELSKVKKREAHRFFEAAEDLKLGEMKFDHPGNLYQFIELHDDGKTSRIVWGDDKSPVNQKVKDLFIALNDLAKTGIKR